MVYVIIGNGPAGVSAIERIREIDPWGKILIVSRENNPPYSRILTPEYMTGEVQEEDLYRRDQDFYAESRVETRLGRIVTKVIPEKNLVILDDQEEIVYDKLLIATGSSPQIPFPVDKSIGIFTLWNKSDSEKIKDYLPEVKQAVIIGGGLVGLQAARALRARGIAVTVIEKVNRLMPAQLDETSGLMLREILEKNQVKVLLNTSVLSLESKDGKISAVKIEKMDIPADMVLIATGIKPNLEMVYDTGIGLDQGLLVNEQMQTSVGNIYAAGDVAQATCRLTGEKRVRAIWPCAIEQGKVAGANMAGVSESYMGSTAMNSFQLFDFSLLSVGQLETGGDIEEKILRYPSSGSYQKLLLKEGKLQGLIFTGDIRQAGILLQKIGADPEKGYGGTIPSVNVENVGA